jgi:hypothetical protein
MRMRPMVILALGAIFISGAASAACLQSEVGGQSIEGGLTTYRLPPTSSKKAGPRERFIATLPAPACLNDEATTSPTVEIWSLDEAIRVKMRGLVKKNVVVRGTPYRQSRAHHEAPITMRVDEISPK